MRPVVLLFVLGAVFAAFAEKQPFERYQSILDRQMFGPLPPGFNPDQLPSEVQRSSASDKELTKEQEKLQSAIHFSVLDVKPDGEVAVGFTDNSDPKCPRNYFLRVGESRDGWEVRSADPDAATMTIAKGDLEVSLTLGGNSAKEAGATSKASGDAGRQSASGGRPGGLLGGANSLRARRLMREKAAADAKAKADAAAAEREAARQEVEAAERQQREAERDAERAEQREQLLAIQEELRRVREEKAAQRENAGEGGGAEDAAQ